MVFPDLTEFIVCREGEEPKEGEIRERGSKLRTKGLEENRDSKAKAMVRR